MNRDISPAGDIVRRVVAEAEMVLEYGRTFMTKYG